MPDQKQTVIVEVRADEVRVGDELWLDGPAEFVELQAVVPFDNPDGAPAGTWVRFAYDGDRYGLTGRARPRPCVRSVLVRRPVPSGADALREALVGLVELFAGGCHEVEMLDASAGVAIPECEHDEVAKRLDAARAALAAVPAVASSGAEGEREAERFRRAINLLRATADQRRKIATNDLSRPADARSRAASAAREFADAADVLAAAPAPAVTDPEGDERETLLNRGNVRAQGVVNAFDLVGSGAAPVDVLADQVEQLRVWARDVRDSAVAKRVPAPSKETSTDDE